MLLTIHFGMLSGSWQHHFIKASEPPHARLFNLVCLALVRQATQWNLLLGRHFQSCDDSEQ